MSKRQWSRIPRIGAVALAAVLVVGMGSVPTQARRAPEPGAAGIGDPYYPFYGNGGYRVSHYDIDVAYDPGTGRLKGTTVITARTTKDLSAFHLDFLLRTTSVTVNGVDASYQRQRSQELVVTPASPLSAGEVMRIKVGYAGVPENVEIPAAVGGWYSPGRGALGLGEPEVAVLWYPSNDHPRDKATFDITVRVPPGVEAISNGSLESVGRVGDDRVWRWRVGSPMATYLAFLAIGQYEVEQGTTPSGLPYLNAYSTRLGSYEVTAKRSVRMSPLIAEWEAGIFGPYPFEQIGGVIPPFPVGFALENQTRPVYSKLFFGGHINTYVIVHELAHQWYGDSVSLHNWRDIWLNEGFATYAEWLWSDYTAFTRPNQSFRAAYDAFGERSGFWKVEVGDPGPENLFAFPVYLRGAMTLQAIHNVVGGPDFRRILRTWATVKADSNGTTRQFRRLAERISGQDLRRVFRVWLHTTTKPKPTAANGYPTGPARTAMTPRQRASFHSMMETTKRLARAESAG